MSPLADEQQAYIEKWEQALRVLENMTEHERTKHFDMGDWGRETDCGTVACLAGHCSFDPWFREHGFAGTFEQGVRYVDGKAVRTNVLMFQREPEDFFGLKGYEEIFMNTSATYEEIVEQVREQVEYLKNGGDPGASAEEDYDDEY